MLMTAMERNEELGKPNHTYGHLTQGKHGTAEPEVEIKHFTGTGTTGQLCEKNKSWLLPTPNIKIHSRYIINLNVKDK